MRAPPPSIKIRGPNSWRARAIAWAGVEFQRCDLGFWATGFISDRERTTSATGVRAYGSLRAVFPPMMITSNSARRARKTERSALEPTPRDEPALLVEPSAPTTREAQVLMALAFQFRCYFTEKSTLRS